jgi:hypothetical protein
VALERLQRRVPVSLHFWFQCNPIWDTSLELPSNYTISWSKDESRAIQLQGCLFNR